MKQMADILKTLGKSFRSVILVIGLSVIASALLQITSINLQRLVINWLLKDTSLKQVLGAGLIAVITIIFALVLGQLSERYGCRFINAKRKTLFSTFSHLNLDAVDNKKCLDIYKNYFPEFSRLVNASLPNFLAIITTTTIMALTTAIWDLKILVIVLITAAIYSLTIPLTRKLEKIEMTDGENSEKIWQSYQNIIANRSVFIFYPQSLYFLTKLQTVFATAQTLSKSKAKIFARIYILGLGTNVVRELSILFLAFSYFEMPVGDVLALFSVTSFLNSAIAQLMNGYADLQKTVVALKKITILESLPTEKETTGEVVFDTPLKAHKLGYAWEKKEISFPDFEIGKGELVQICGGNGTGKSTLLAILAGIRNPNQGNLNYQQVERRKLTYFVTQYQFIFTGSILENITCFEPVPDREKVKKLLQQVGLWPWVLEQEAGLATEISGKKGLSGGQKQRLCICRALYQAKALLLLDEPFSSIDDCNRQKLTALFEQYCHQGGSIVFTSHQTKTSFSGVRQIDLESV